MKKAIIQQWTSLSKERRVLMVAKVIRKSVEEKQRRDGNGSV